MFPQTQTKELRPAFLELYLNALLIDNLSEFEKEQQKNALIILEQGIKEQFLIKILDKRIQALNLSVKFTLGGYLAALALCKSPGNIVCLLIDCLETEKEIIDSKILAEIYPWGFYSEEAFHKRVEEELKTRKTKFAWVY